jgi:peroxiredoxin
MKNAVQLTLLIILFSTPAWAQSPALKETLKNKTANPVLTQAVVGQPAPDFTLPGTDGKLTTLSDLKGKVVVLEWFNPDCPFVKIAHGEGHLRKRAAQHLAHGGAWLAINSNADGMQGHGQERNAKAVIEYGLGWPVLLDPMGKVGHLYQAKRTPHIYVIDPKGVLVYAGALDSSGGGGYKDVEVKDFLAEAITAAKKGVMPGQTETKAWGCSVKYAR